MPARKIFKFEREPKSPEEIEAIEEKLREAKWTAEGKPAEDYLREQEIEKMVEEKQGKDQNKETKGVEALPNKEPISKGAYGWEEVKLKTPKQVGKALRGRKYTPSQRRETIRRPEANP